MATLSCLSLFEAGAFGSNSGTVVIPTMDTPFPTTVIDSAVGRGTSYGFATLAEVVATGDQDDLFVILY